MNLSEQAEHVLLHAHTYPGGHIGDGPGEALDELHAAGLIGSGSTLTDEGAAAARQLKEAFWRDPLSVDGQPSHGLSDGAAGRLLNAERHTGGAIGIGHEADEQELRTAGLVTDKGNLTAKGAALARRIQDDRWPDD